MVVQRPKQPTATIGKFVQRFAFFHIEFTVLAASTSFDGPATTDAALAALAAEAGLIDPEPEKETPIEKEIGVVEAADTEETQMDTNENSEESDETATVLAATDATSVVDSSSEAPNIGLFGGGTIHQKLGLKGGSKIRLGLFGGSPIGPPVVPFTYRGGLFGGSKDSPELTNTNTTDMTENEVEEAAALNGTKKEEGDAPVKMETDEVDMSDNPLDTSTSDSGISTAPSSQQGFDCKVKEESGDALSALASAALDHSKEFKQELPQEIKSTPPIDEKDVWYTVGFIKGNSFDVHNYCYCDDDTTEYTSDNIPDLSDLQRISLEPGTAYKFRVAAINSVGRGDWSEVTKRSYKV